MPDPKRFTYTNNPVPAQGDPILTDFLRREFEAIKRAFDQDGERLTDLEDTKVFAMVETAINTTSQAVADIGDAVWQPITQLGTIVIDDSHITLNPTTGEFSIGRPSTIQLSFMGTLSHNESIPGRALRVRLYDVTNATGGSGVVIGVGRNQPATNINVGIVAPVTQGNTLRLEIIAVAGDSFTAVTWTDKTLNLVSVST